MERGALATVKVGRERLYINTRFVDLLMRDEDVNGRRLAVPTLF